VAEAVALFVTMGTTAAMNKFNTREPPISPKPPPRP